MASTGINFANLTPDNGAVRDLKELIFRSVLGVEQLGSMFNVLPNQKHGDKVGLIGEFGLLGKASEGCDPTYDHNVLATTEKEWDLREWQISEEICYKDLEGTLAQVALKTKSNIADLTGTEYLDYVLMPRLEIALRKMLMRFAWFGDKEANTTTNGGVLKEGTRVGAFNVVDGIFKRAFALAAANSARHTVVEANAKTTFAEQKEAIREADAATDILDNLITDAPQELRQAEGQVIFISQALKDALNADIKKNHKGSDLAWEAIFDGITKTTYNGIELVAVPFWDEIIKGYESASDGKAWNKPYRAIYTVRDNLLLGLGSENEIADLQIFFSQKDQKTYILAKDKMGSLIADDNLIQVAF
jgi:hypothetical protein